MTTLKFMAWSAVCLAVLNFAAAAIYGNLFFVGGGVSLVVSGVLFSALDRIVAALESIRDLIAQQRAANEPINRAVSGGTRSMKRAAHEVG